METQRTTLEGFSAIGMLATLSVFALLGVGTWKTYGALAKGGHVVSATNSPPEKTSRASTPFGSVNWQAPVLGDTEAGVSSEAASDAAKEDKDGISNIAGNVVGALVSSYTALAEAGAYTPEEGERIAKDIGESLRANVSYKRYEAANVKTDPDASYDRMLAYRNDLRIALEPLLKNPGYELAIFATYIETRDKKYTDQLKIATENYRAAIANAATIVVPQDALTHHLGILNALSEFGATIEAMANHADDPFASAALLRTYNGSEALLLTSFDKLATYYRSKQP